MSILKEIFSDGKHLSSMRIMSFISLIVGVGVGIYSVISGANLSDAAALTAVFVGSAFCGKSLQSYSERE